VVDDALYIAPKRLRGIGGRGTVTPKPHEVRGKTAFHLAGLVAAYHGRVTPVELSINHGANLLHTEQKGTKARHI
jgi:hypothetical protein